MNRIKALRLEHNFTQQQLADLIGVQKSAVAKYENDIVTNLKRSKIKLLAEIFNVSPSYIMNLDSINEGPTNYSPQTAIIDLNNPKQQLTIDDQKVNDDELQLIIKLIRDQRNNNK